MEKQVGVGELVKRTRKLISLPDIYFKIEQMIANGQYSNRDFGKVIAQDPGLTGRLLKIVNSALFNFGGRIDTVSRAITLVGHNELKMLVLATSSSNIFKTFATDLIDVVKLWQYSLLTGIVARLLASKCHVLHPERLFIAGLLHDVGHLIIFTELPKQAEIIIQRSAQEPGNSIEIEKSILGFDYTDVNFQLARDWRFPESLQVALKCHLKPELAPSFKLEAAIVHIAKEIALMQYDPLAQSRISDVAWEISGLDESMIEAVQIDASVQFAEALEIIMA